MDECAATFKVAGDAEVKTYKKYFVWRDDTAENEQFEVKFVQVNKEDLEAKTAELPRIGELYKANLQNTLNTMPSKDMFEKLIFYPETCESGNMFEGLSIPGAYVLSAASPSESSWDTYCGTCTMVVGTSSGSSRGGRPLVAGRACSPRWGMLRGACHGTSRTPWRRSRSDAMIDGMSIGPCLGDLFSENWMEDFDASSLRVRLLDVNEAKVNFSKPLVEAILTAVTTSRDVDLAAELLAKVELPRSDDRVVLGILRSRVMLLPRTLNVSLAMQQRIKLRGTPENIVFDAKRLVGRKRAGEA